MGPTKPETPLQKVQRTYGSNRAGGQDALDAMIRALPPEKPKAAPVPQAIPTTPPKRVQTATALRERQKALDLAREELARQAERARINAGR